MVVGTVVAVVAAAVLVLVDAGLRPNETPVVPPVVAAAVVIAELEVMVAAPRGLSIKAKPPAAGVVVAVEALGAEVEAPPKVKPVLAVVVGAAVAMGAEKRERPEAGADWRDAGGAGVAEGLIPNVHPTPKPAVVAAVAAGWFWLPKVRLDGALAPKLKPPLGAAGGAADVVTWALVAPKLNPPKEVPKPVVAMVVGAAGVTVGWGA